MVLYKRIISLFLTTYAFGMISSICIRTLIQRNYDDLYLNCTLEPLPFSIKNASNRCYNCRSLILILSNSNISEMAPSSFLEVPYTQSLILTDNFIHKISPGSFTGLHNLKKLNLSNNELTDITHGVFNSLITLNTLDLSVNKIKNLDPNFLTGLLDLTYLDLSRNSLPFFDDVVLAQTKLLKQLNLSDNSISELILKTSMNRIFNLDVSKNNLSEIDICFPGLVTLNVSFNKISTLLANNCSSLKIKRLDLSFNLLNTSNIKNISNLFGLEYLNIRSNNLIFIPSDLFVLFENLIYLDLSHNNLQDINYGVFDHLSNLYYLDLSYNKLISIKRYLHSLTTLKTLLINNNNLKNLDSKQILKDMPYLNNVRLDNNDFSCNDLVEIVHDLNSKINRISRGTSTNISNIHGIACNEFEIIDSKFKEEFVTYLKDIISSKLDNSQSNHFERSVTYNYFNKDFKNSNFYKYLESLKAINSQNFNGTDILKYFNEDFEKSKFYKFLESLKTNENHITQFNKSLYNYFNTDFNTSNFVRYLNKLEESKSKFMEDFENSSMFSYFNKGFESSSFYKFFQNFKFHLNEPVSSINNSYNSEFLQGNFKSANNTSTNYSGFLSVICLSLVILTVFKFVELYARYNKNKPISSEQVELVDNSA